MPKFLLKLTLALMLATAGLHSTGFAQAAGESPAPAVPAHSISSAHLGSHDDPAYRLRQRHRLAAMIAVLLVVAFWHVARKPKSSAPGARG